MCNKSDIVDHIYIFFLKINLINITFYSHVLWYFHNTFLSAFHTTKQAVQANSQWSTCLLARGSNNKNINIYIQIHTCNKYLSWRIESSAVGVVVMVMVAGVPVKGVVSGNGSTGSNLW